MAKSNDPFRGVGASGQGTIPLASPPLVTTPLGSSAPLASDKPATGVIPAPKPSQAGTTPTGLFINEDGSINMQRSLEAAKQKAAEIAKGVQTLSVQQAPTANIQGVVSSSESVVNEENKVKEEVAAATVPSAAETAAKAASDAYLATLDEQSRALEQRRKDEIASIEASAAATKAAAEKGQIKETGTTNVALLRAGGYLGTQISGVGVLNNLADAHRAELSALDAKKAAAINEANNAINDRQFKIAELKAKEAKDIDKEINDRRNEFFDQSMKVLQENRAKEAEARLQASADFKTSLDTIDRIAPTIVESIQGLDDNATRDFILGAARDLNMDPNLIIGTVNSLIKERADEVSKQVTTLAQKYPGADIDPATDDFTTATAKIRSSREYQVDALKAEMDLENIRSLISQRSGDQSVDYSDPVLAMYTAATGEVISSPGKARGVIGYANAILGDKEIVSNDFTGPLLDNQIKESEARNLINGAFANIPKEKGFGEVSDASVYSWLSTPDAQMLTDEQKRNFILEAGKNPEDFGIY